MRHRDKHSANLEVSITPLFKKMSKKTAASGSLQTQAADSCAQNTRLTCQFGMRVDCRDSDMMAHTYRMDV